MQLPLTMKTNWMMNKIKYMNESKNDLRFCVRTKSRQNPEDPQGFSFSSVLNMVNPPPRSIKMLTYVPQNVPITIHIKSKMDKKFFKPKYGPFKKSKRAIKPVSIEIPHIIKKAITYASQY